MKLFGLEITLAKASEPRSLNAVDTGRGGWYSIFGSLREPWGGAWQGAIEPDRAPDLLAFSAIYSCVSGIASDVAKIRVRVVEEDAAGVCTEVAPGFPRAAVLAKPNHYQTRFKFIEQWVISKLIHGNTYALKRRDGRSVVDALYLLDPETVTPLVTESGEIYYRLKADNLSSVGKEGLVVPASDVIHDSMPALWHPLVGVSPIRACAMTGTLANRISANSTAFFGNMSAPSGMLTAPGSIGEETAARLKTVFEEGFSGKRIGRLFVGGDGLEFKGISIPAADAQLVEQVKMSVEDVARAFHYPLFKLGGAVPNGSTVEQLNQAYYSECLQPIIEAMEGALDDGLGIESPYYTEFDVEEGLLRMDTAAKAEAEANLVKGGIKAPDEARRRFNLPPVPGGKYPYLQQQNYSLEALAKRDALPDPFKTAPAAPVAQPAANDEDDGATAMAAAVSLIVKGLEAENAAA